MGLVDYFARKRGYIKPDEAKTQKRSFNGAAINRLTASWTTTPKPFDTDIRNGLRTLRARSREQSINNDYVRRFLGLVKSNVVGPSGIILQARNIDNNGKLDSLANTAIEEAWQEWGEHGTPDVSGCMSWVDIQRLFIETIVKDGEVLMLKHTNWKDNQYRFALEFVDIECLDVEHNQDLENGNTIKMGIELNKFRKPVAYHLLVSDASQQDYLRNGKKYRRVTADRVIHRFLPESVWQTRGFPWLASALMRMNMLNGYEEAELVAARVGSSKMGFFESESGENYQGEEDLDGNIVTDAEPGTFEMLPQGVKFSAWDPSHPSTAFGDFVKVILRGIASGLGVSYFSLANDLEGVNYSSARIGSLEDREAWKALQNWMVDCFCKPVFKEWLNYALLSGSIVVAGKHPLSARKFDKHKRVSWQPRRWAWVDPQKDMNAATTAIEHNIRSTSDVIREQGRDPEEVWQEIKRERERWKELEIEPASAGFLMPGEKANEREDEE